MDGRERFPRQVREDPSQAAQFVACAGPALLLIPGAAQNVRILNAHLSGLDALAPPVPKPTDRATGMNPGAQVAVAGVFSVVALAGVFGPGEYDGFDSTMFSVSEDVTLLWEATTTVYGTGG
jgi:hypothetical protein